MRRERALRSAISSSVVTLLVLAGPTAGASGSGQPSARSLPVVSCPIPAIDIGGQQSPPVPARASPPLPASVDLPKGVTLFGTAGPQPSPGSPSSTTYSIGPSGSSCSAAEGADGATYISISAPGSNEPEIFYDYSPGGVGLQADLPCGYIPSLNDALQAYRNTDQPCAPADPDDAISQVPTGDPDLVASVVAVPTSPPNHLSAQQAAAESLPASTPGTPDTTRPRHVNPSCPQRWTPL